MILARIKSHQKELSSMLGVEKVTIDGITSGGETAKEQLVRWKIRLRSSSGMHRKGWDEKENRHFKR